MAYQGKGELAPIMAPGRPRGCGGAPPRDHVLTRQAGSSLPLATTPLLTVDSSCRRPTGRSRRSSRMPANQSSAKLDNLPWLPSLHRYGAGAASLLGQAPVLRNAHGIGHAVARDRRSSPEIGATTYGIERDTDGTAQALLPPDISWQIRCSNSLDRFSATAFIFVPSHFSAAVGIVPVVSLAGYLGRGWPADPYGRGNRPRRLDRKSTRLNSS